MKSSFRHRLDRVERRNVMPQKYAPWITDGSSEEKETGFGNYFLRRRYVRGEVDCEMRCFGHRRRLMSTYDRIEKKIKVADF
jgi:hypothetical protein